MGKLEEKPKDLNKYFKDIQTIKDLLIEAEEKPIVEYWAFITWSIFILVGCILHYIFDRFYALSHYDLFIKIWLPILIVGSIFETISWLRANTKESIPLFSRFNIKTLFFVISICIVFFLLVGLLLKLNGLYLLPVVIFIGLGISLCIMAILSNILLFAHAFVFMGLAIIVFFLELRCPEMTLVAGACVSLNMIAAGLTLKPKKQND